MGLERLTDEELEEIGGKNKGRAKAVLEARKASEDAKHKLRATEWNTLRGDMPKPGHRGHDAYTQRCSNLKSEI
jgi:hypothetical protein